MTLLPPPTGACRPRRRRGSLLVMVVIALFAFLIGHLGYAGAQITHARAQHAELGRLQAVYAAESGVWAAFKAHANVATTTLWTAGGDQITYAGVREIVDGPTWVTGTGMARLGGETYTATVRGYVLGEAVVLWEFPR